MKLLLTGFKAFGGSAYNMTEKILKTIHNPKVDVLVLDVHYERAFQQLENHLQEHTYDMVIAFGEAPIQKIQLEYLALNMMHARIPDERTFQPKHTRIVPNGPMTYPSNLPLHEMETFLKSHHIEYQVSYHAGTYVCNDLFYRMMHRAYKIPSGFIHIPHELAYESQTKKAIESMIQWLLTYIDGLR